MKSNEVKFGVDIWENGMYNRFVRYVLAVKKLGFDSIWAADAHRFDLLVKLTVAAVKTKRAKVGTVVLVPSRRDPVFFGKNAIFSRSRLRRKVNCWSGCRRKSGRI